MAKRLASYVDHPCVAISLEHMADLKNCGPCDLLILDEIRFVADNLRRTQALSVDRQNADTFISQKLSAAQKGTLGVALAQASAALAEGAVDNDAAMHDLTICIENLLYEAHLGHSPWLPLALPQARAVATR